MRHAAPPLGLLGIMTKPVLALPGAAGEGWHLGPSADVLEHCTVMILRMRRGSQLATIDAPAPEGGMGWFHHTGRLTRPLKPR
jgi:hypothetical protein